MNKSELIAALTTSVEVIDVNRGAVNAELLEKIEEWVNKAQGSLQLKGAAAALLGVRPDEISSILTSAMQFIALERYVLDSGIDLKVRASLEHILASPLKLMAIAAVL